MGHGTVADRPTVSHYKADVVGTVQWWQIGVPCPIARSTVSHHEVDAVGAVRRSATTERTPSVRSVVAERRTMFARWWQIGVPRPIARSTLSARHPDMLASRTLPCWVVDLFMMCQRVSRGRRYKAQYPDTPATRKLPRYVVEPFMRNQGVTLYTDLPPPRERSSLVPCWQIGVPHQGVA